jgi:hypothetical protein
VSFIDWLLGGRSKRKAPPVVQHLFAAEGLFGVLYADGRVRSFRADGTLVHAEQVHGPRVAWDGEQLVDSQPEHFHGLPFYVSGELLQVGKGELRHGERVEEAEWLMPSAQMKLVRAEDGRVALLDPFMNKAIVLSDQGLSRVGERALPVMDGCFEGEDLLLVREGHIERYNLAGERMDRVQPHGLQTLAVGPGASLGLDAKDQLELRRGDEVHTLGPAPEHVQLFSEGGLVCTAAGGFFTDGVTVEVPHQGLLVAEDHILVASDPPALYNRSGRCVRQFDPVR